MLAQIGWLLAEAFLLTILLTSIQRLGEDITNFAPIFVQNMRIDAQRDCGIHVTKSSGDQVHGDSCAEQGGRM